jgi:hypothetical protein
VYRSTTSKGSIEDDLQSEWNELAVKQYSITDSMQATETQEAEGWKIKAASGKFTFNNQPAAVLLTTFSGYDRCVSIVATTNSQTYLEAIETFNGTIELKKPEAGRNTHTPLFNDPADSAITGTWIKSGSVNPVYADAVSWGAGGYTKNQYTFNANGTYTFYSKSFGYSVTNIILAKESGSFTIYGNKITLTPKTSVVEGWSKKDNTDKWGQLVSSQKRNLETTVYTFTKHYFSGIQIWNLVLQANSPTSRDGSFSTNTTFTNAYYYAPPSNNNLAIDLPPGAGIKSEVPASNKQESLNYQTKSNSGYHFTTSNFDDGWTSTVQEDWVQVTKANIKVLIHYPNKQADTYNSVLMDGLKNAWNILVAPRYSSATNFEFKPISGWQPIEFAEADMTDKTTGKTVHVVLFKMNYSNGTGKYLEFITADKNAFEQEFGAYHQTTSGWEKMENMAMYNKFAVAASDLNGKWSSNFTGMTQYVNAYTGADAGANTHASNENYEFGAGNTYKWDLGVASGFVGNIKFQSVKSSGNFTMLNDWQVKFSDIEGKPKTYNVQFVCIKDARVLWIGDTGFGKKE